MNLLDKKDNGSPDAKYISFENNNTLKNECKFSFTQNRDQLVKPNDSFQGMEFSNGGSIYVAGGKKEDIPQIAKMDGLNHSYSALVNIINNKKREIEGLQIKADNIYFGICDHTNKSQQYIYSVKKTCFE